MASNVHRFKKTGDGRIKHYSCSCGNWNTSGSEARTEGIKAAWSQHASQGARGRGDVAPDPGDAGSSGSGSGSDA